MKKHKRSPAVVGMVMHRILDMKNLEEWSQYLATIEPWKIYQMNPQGFARDWSDAAQKWNVFSAAEPREAKQPGFEHQHGLIAFQCDGAVQHWAAQLQTVPSQLQEDGGVIGVLAAKTRSRGVGKYLLGLAERVISESKRRVFLSVGEQNRQAIRFYESMGYEEIAQIHNYPIVGNTEIILTKYLLPESNQ